MVGASSAKGRDAAKPTQVERLMGWYLQSVAVAIGLWILIGGLRFFWNTMALVGALVAGGVYLRHLIRGSRGGR